MKQTETAITAVQGYEILDSRGNPTVACRVYLADGETGYAFVPSGASTGEYEAYELRDGDNTRYNGKGVQTAVNNINNTIGPSLEGVDAHKQAEVDRHMSELDGTANKQHLGANAILAVSLAMARAVSNSRGLPLYQYLHILYSEYDSDQKLAIPYPALNIINGGEHADSGLAVQEFMIIPQFEDTSRNLQVASEVYHNLKHTLEKDGYRTSVGDEGGFAPKLTSSDEAFQYLQASIEDSGYTVGTDCVFGIDVAATEFYNSETETYTFGAEDLSAAGLSEYYKRWMSAYPLQTIEDPFAEDDFSAWSAFMKSHGEGQAIIGDDLLVTNESRIKTAIRKEAANALLVKPNQVGTLTETFEAIQLVYEQGWEIMLSHRSGETSDTFIADLAVAVGAKWMKSGAPARGERTAKYNRLLEIAKIDKQTIIPFIYE
ncbi:MAG: phosphopyruvate hydratase [Candidatus Paceibacteria bacterium]